MPAHRRLRGDPENLDRQGAEVRATRAGERAWEAVRLTLVIESHGWADHCRSRLAATVASAVERFPGRGEEAPERVHGLRKALKESRALARLFLPSLGESARVTIAALAVVRRRVGRVRDLDVMASRIEKLATAPEIAAPLLEAIERERAAAERAHTHFAAAASRAQLRSIVKRIEGWDLAAVSDEHVAAAVERTYEQALRRGRLAFAGADTAALHALRSRVVDLRYQLSALSPAWPAALNAQSDELNALRDTLGDFNDHDVLERFIAGRNLMPAAQSALSERIDAKKAKLRRRAETEFARLFAETPDAFATRLSAYLRNPRRKD